MRHEYERQERVVQREIDRLKVLLFEWREAEADVAAAETVIIIRPEDAGEIRRVSALNAVIAEADRLVGRTTS